MKTMTLLAAVFAVGLLMTTGCSTTCCKKDGACAKPAMKCSGACCADAATCAKCCTDAAGCAACCKKP